MNITNFSLHIVISNFTHTHTHTHTQLYSFSTKNPKETMKLSYCYKQSFYSWKKWWGYFSYSKTERNIQRDNYYKMVSDSASLACQHSTTYCQIYHSIDTLFVNTVANTKIAMQIPVNKWDQNRRKLHILKVFCKNAHGHLLSNNEWVKNRW